MKSDNSKTTESGHPKNRNTFQTNFFMRICFKSLYFSGWLIIWLTLLNSASLSAQSPDSRIDIYNPNMRLLEYLVKLEIDSIRRNNFLKPLYNDSICFLAAKDQGEYLMDYDEISHFREENPAKRSPQDRADFYGAKGYRVGENIVKLYVDMPFLYSKGAIKMRNVMIRTYQETARFIVQAWVNSAEHYVNILSTLYDVTGIFAVFNEDNRSLICVQVFADVDSSYRLKSYPSVFPYDKIITGTETLQFSDTEGGQNCNFNNAWGLDLMGDSRDLDSSKVLNNILSNCFVILKDHDLFINFGLYNAAIKLFGGENDGLALEMVPEDIYSCRNQNQAVHDFPENCPVKGMITRPVFRDKILKKNLQFKDIHSNQKFLIPLAGILPDVNLDSFETNILVIKNKKIWRIIQTHHLCGNMPEVNLLPRVYPGDQPEHDKFEDSIFLAANSTTGYNINPTDTISWMISEYNRIFEDFLSSCGQDANNCEGDSEYNQLNSIQYYLLRKYQQAEIDYSRIRSLPALITDDQGNLTRYQPFGKLYYDRVMFEYTHNPSEMTGDRLLNILAMLKKLRNPLPEVLYNYWALDIRMQHKSVSDNFTPATLREIADVIDRSRGIVPQNYLDTLTLFYHFTKIHDSYQNELIDLRQIYKSMDFIYNFYSANNISVDDKVKIARLFILFRLYNFAFQLLEPVIQSNSFYKEAYILDLKLYYSGMIVNPSLKEYYSRLIEASDFLTDKEWTGLFEGPCRINFQNLNYKPLRMLYCAKKRNMELSNR